jgi:geranylgeranyl pyrophosphate synthase
MLGGASARELQLLERIALYWGIAYQMTDDLKDVLDSKAKAGKTVARDLLLDRPNSASAMGIPSAITRLTRFIDLGDRTLARLMQSRLGLSFLGRLRSSLEDELVRITANLKEMSLGARP